MKIITSESFNINYKGEETKLFTITNNSGVTCQITNYGARVVAIFTPDKNGDFKDIVVGYDSGRDFIEKDESFFGATIGRFGNRIGNGQFTIDDVKYKIATNDGMNTLHGGLEGFDKKVWETKQINKSTLEFLYESPDMEEGFPGNLAVKVIYQLTDENELKIEYFAESDKKTIVNLTNHTYFNLGGHDSGSILNHLLKINADNFTPVSEGMIPIGGIISVKETPLDFTEFKSIGKDIENEYEQLKLGNGYDHNFVINKYDELIPSAAKVIDPNSGRTLEVYTNEPGMQFYSANWLNGKGKNNTEYKMHEAFCLETQHYPDSPNKPNFPSTTLDIGEQYYSICIYKFGVE